jgi:predicted RNA binding protein YcfA (HicA-like mRNA interferase family)
VKLPRDISGAEAVKALERLGFSITRQTGSHVRMAQGNRRVTVPMHRNLVVGTLQSILHQAGVGLDDFVNAL